MERTENNLRAVVANLSDPEDATLFAVDIFDGGEGGDGVATGEGGGCSAVAEGGGGGATGEGGGCSAVAEGGGGGATGEGEGGLAAARSSVRHGQEPVASASAITQYRSSVRHVQEPVASASAITQYRYFQNRYDQYMDLYIHGRPICSYWEPLWAGRPLVFHDRGLVSAHEFVKGRRNSEVQELYLGCKITYDLTSEISDIIRNHPGPIDYFRLDSSCLPDAKTLLVEWVKILSEKRIQQLIMVNVEQPTDMLFPIEDLQSSRLKHLCLAFMRIPDLDLNVFEYSSLVTLQLYSCSTSGRRLSWVISHCACLTDLIIGLSTENFRVISDSLLRVQLWQCQASWLAISCCPKLKSLSLGVAPARGSGSVSISVDSAPELLHLNGLQLPLHDMTINGTFIAKDFTSLNSVEQLTLGLNMSSADQRSAVLNILRCMPMLKHLTLRRMDGIDVGVGIDLCLNSTFDNLRDSTCVNTQLQNFTIESFKGGPAEVHILGSIIRYARCLVLVRIVCCGTCSQQDIDDAIEEIRNFSPASKDCRVRILGAPDKC